MSVKSTHQCFHLIYFLLYHTGCLGCKIKKENELYYDKWHKLYGNVYRFICLFGLISGLIYKIYDEELNQAFMGQMAPVIKIILTFECIVSPLLYVQVILHLDLYRNKYVNLANALQTLDEELQKNFGDIQFNYQKSARKYNFLIVGLYGFYVIVSTMYIFNIMDCKCGWVSTIIISVSYAYVTGAPAFAEILLIGNMDFLRLRFRLIRKILQQNFLITYGNYSLIQSDIANLKLLENYFTKYSNLILHFNQMFCVINGSGVFHDFVIITSLGYLLCSKALDMNSKVHEYVFILLLLAPRIYKTVSTAIYGHATQKERQNCCGEFLRIGYYLKKSPLVHKQMEDFLHWRLHNNYRITLGKILTCNITLIFLIFNNVGNYIIILIQLQFQQNNIVKKFINNKDLINDDVNC